MLSSIRTPCENTITVEEDERMLYVNSNDEGLSLKIHRVCPSYRVLLNLRCHMLIFADGGFRASHQGRADQQRLTVDRAVKQRFSRPVPNTWIRAHSG